MKSFALINRNTGDIFEGKRVWFNDCLDDLMSGYAIVTIGDYDGWLIFHPNEAWGGHWLFFNRKCEEFFEVLGEL